MGKQTVVCLLLLCFKGHIPKTKLFKKLHTNVLPKGASGDKVHRLDAENGAEVNKQSVTETQQTRQYHSSSATSIFT